MSETSLRDTVPADVLRSLRFALTEDDFPFYNRHGRRIDQDTIPMWAERDVLDLIDQFIAWAERDV